MNKDKNIKELMLKSCHDFLKDPVTSEVTWKQIGYNEQPEAFETKFKKEYEDYSITIFLNHKSLDWNIICPALGLDFVTVPFSKYLTAKDAAIKAIQYCKNVSQRSSNFYKNL